MTYRLLRAGAEPELVVIGPTLADLFEYSVLAVFDVAFAIDRVRVTRDVPVMAVGDTPDSLLEDWIGQAIAAADAHDLVVATVAVDRLEMGGVQGAVGGFARTEEAACAWPPTVQLVSGIVDVPEGNWARLRLSPAR